MFIVLYRSTSSSWFEVTCPDGKHGYMSSEYLTYLRTDTGYRQNNVGFQNQTIEPRQLRDQPFRIYRIVPELTKITVYARHIFYDLLDNMIRSLTHPAKAVGASVAKSISASCMSEHDFTFYIDLTTTATDVKFENINPVEALLGDEGLTGKSARACPRLFDAFLVRASVRDTDVQIARQEFWAYYDVDETKYHAQSCHRRG